MTTVAAPVARSDCGYVSGRAEKSGHSSSSNTRPVMPLTGSSSNLAAAEVFSAIVRDSSPGVPGRRSGEPAPSRSVSTLSADDGPLSLDPPSTTWAAALPAAHLARPLVDFASCPSFKEQRGSKPVFMDRHQTLQRVTEETANALQAAATLAEQEEQAEEATAAAFEADSDPAASAASTAASTAPVERCPYLPGWDISHSSIWSQLEQAVLRNILLEELYGTPSQQEQQHGAAAAKQEAAAAAPAAHHNAHVHAQHVLTQHERRQSFPRCRVVGGSPIRSSPASPLHAATVGASAFPEPNPFASQHAYHSLLSPAGTMTRESPSSPARAPASPPVAAPRAAAAATAAVPSSPSILSRPPLASQSPARLAASSGGAAAAADVASPAAPGTADAHARPDVLASVSEAGATAAAAGMTILNDLVREVLLQRSDTLDRHGEGHGHVGHVGHGHGVEQHTELRGLGPDCPALVPSTSFGCARSLLRHVSRRWGAASDSFGCSSMGRSSFGRESTVLDPAGSSTSNASGADNAATNQNPLASALRSAASHIAASLSGGAAVAGVAAVSSVTAAVAVSSSAALQLGGHALADGADLLMNRVQVSKGGTLTMRARIHWVGMWTGAYQNWTERA